MNEQTFPIGEKKYEAVYAEEAAAMDASELIAEALERSGMTQAALARALGVSRSEISERLSGGRNITVRKLAATLHALGERLDLQLKPAEVDETRALFARWVGLSQHRHTEDLSRPRNVGYPFRGTLPNRKQRA